MSQIKHFSIPRSVSYTPTEVIAFLAISALLLIFLLLRAIHVPMTHDEISTFYMYAQTGDFLPFIDHTDGNNHLLNSFLTYLFYHLLGSSPLALRLSNLAFAPLYFYFCFRLSEQLQSKILGWTLFLTMALTLHYIEFQSLSRGYGLAATFLAGAMWQFITGIRNMNTRNLYLSFVFIFLSATGILSLIYTFGLMLGFSFVFLVLNHKQFKKTEWIKFIAFGVLPLLFVFKFSLFTKANGAYFDGYKVDFWNSTFTSLFMNLGDFDFQGVRYMLLALSVAILIPFLINLYMIFAKGKEAVTYHLLIPYLLLGNATITYFAVKLLDLSFPAERMAFYFYPLIVGSLVFLVDMAIRTTRIKWLVFLALPLAYFPVHFAKAANTEYSVWYKYCHIPERFYTQVMKDYKSGEMPPSVTIHPLQAFAWNFLIRENDSKASLASKVPWPPTCRTQYLIIELTDYPDWPRLYDTLDYDDISNRYLLKAKTDFNWIKLSTAKNIHTDGATNNEYFTLYEIKAEKLRGMTIEAGLDLSVQSFKSLIYGGIIVSVNDSAGNNLIWEPMFFHWTNETWDGKPHNMLNNFVFDMPATASKLSIYFWNIKKSGFAIHAGELTISELGPETAAKIDSVTY